jgi:osmotically-inducible protein OsmY
MMSFDDSGMDADHDLARRVTTFLHSKQQRSLRTVSVEANGGTVVLRGEVGSFYEKQLCLSCTRRVAGVSSLVDEIHVSNYAGVG